MAVVTVSLPADCSSCVELRVQGKGGEPPYRVEWGDGETQVVRRLCGDELVRPLTVVVTDAAGARSAAHLTKRSTDGASCPVADADAGADADAATRPSVAARLCLQNPSFEGQPSTASTAGTSFDGAPWSACINPAGTNAPSLGNDSSQALITAELPKPTDGATWLGLLPDSQVSQPLCQAVTGGSARSFRVDLRRVVLGDNVLPDNGALFLEVHGGIAADCSSRELLWASPNLDTSWNTYCATLQPQQYFDNLVLVARSDSSLGTTSYLVADNLEPVERCP